MYADVKQAFAETSVIASNDYIIKMLLTKFIEVEKTFENVDIEIETNEESKGSENPLFRGNFSFTHAFIRQIFPTNPRPNFRGIIYDDNEILYTREEVDKNFYTMD